MTGQELKECIAEVRHSDMPKPAKKKVMDVLYDELHKKEWIPCSEHMPKKEVPVLCQWHKRNGLDTEVYYSILHVDGDGKWVTDYGMPNGEVVAWQPLPEPYNGEEGNDV